MTPTTYTVRATGGTATLAAAHLLRAALAVARNVPPEDIPLPLTVAIDGAALTGAMADNLAAALAGEPVEEPEPESDDASAPSWDAFWNALSATMPDLPAEPCCGDRDACDACGADAHETREPLFGLVFTVTALEQIHPNNGGGCLVRFSPSGRVSNHWGKRVVAARVEHAWEAPIGEDYVLVSRAVWDARGCL